MAEVEPFPHPQIAKKSPEVVVCRSPASVAIGLARPFAQKKMGLRAVGVEPPLPAASHGKYFSDSDVDLRYINPLVNPPNVSAYRLWTCLQSDDTLIAQACQLLYGRYRPGEGSGSVLQAFEHTATSLRRIFLWINHHHLLAA